MLGVFRAAEVRRQGYRLVDCEDESGGEVSRATTRLVRGTGGARAHGRSERFLAGVVCR